MSEQENNSIFVSTDENSNFDPSAGATKILNVNGTQIVDTIIEELAELSKLDHPSIAKIFVKSATTGPLDAYSYLLDVQEDGWLKASVVNIATGAAFTLGIKLFPGKGVFKLIGGMITGAVLAYYTNKLLDNMPFEEIIEEFENYEQIISNVDFKENSKSISFRTSLSINAVEQIVSNFLATTHEDIDIETIKINQYTTNNNGVTSEQKFSCVRTEKLIGLSNLYNTTFEEIQSYNNWLEDVYVNNGEYIFIEDTQQLYIPENVLRGSVSYDESFETVRDIYTGEKSPSDLINYEIPEDSEFYVPQGGESQEITYQYTQAPAVDAKALTMQILSGLSIVTNGQVLMYLQYPQLFPQANEYMKNFAGLPSLPSVAQTMPLGIPMVSL